MSGLLAGTLLAPWFLILCWVYWRFGRAAARPRGFDVAAVLLAMVTGVGAGVVGLAHADPGHGRLWPQIFAVLLAYGVFLLVLLVAAIVRRRLKPV